MFKLFLVSSVELIKMAADDILAPFDLQPQQVAVEYDHGSK